MQDWRKLQWLQQRYENLNSRHHTFLSKRFDRTSTGERIHFASAMTLLHRSDGDDANKNPSYLELARIYFLEKKEEKRRIGIWNDFLASELSCFICVSNVDDHLRNHGFIYSLIVGLSPAYDVNPVASGEGLKLNISETDNSQDLALLPVKWLYILG